MSSHNPTVHLVCALAVSLATSCSTKTATPERAEPETQEVTHTGIPLPTQLIRNLGISFAPVQVRSVSSTLRIPGTFEFTPLARREYRMPLAGHVEIMVDENQLIEPGQLLFRFRSPAWPELQHEIIVSEQAIQTALAAIDLSEAKLQGAGDQLQALRGRLVQLEGASLPSAELQAEEVRLSSSVRSLRAELGMARTQLDNAHSARAHALHRAAQASGLAEESLEKKEVVGQVSVPGYRTIDWIDVRASRAAVVERIAQSDGAFAPVPALVLSTIDPSQLRFRALALQADLPLLSSITEAQIVPAAGNGVGLAESVPAALQLGLEAHPQERTLVAFAAPQSHAPWIRNGVSAFLEIVVASSDPKVLAIPESAIVQDGLEHVFFRRKPANPGEVLRVVADLGVSDGRWREIRSGIQRGDTVVLQGVYELKIASRGATELPDVHVHADGSVHTNH